jgi:hypothetical protein
MDEDSWVQWKWPSTITKIHQKKWRFFLVYPNLYVQTGPNPLRIKFPFILYPKKKFHSKKIHPQKYPPTRDSIFHSQKFLVKTLLKSTPKWVLAKIQNFNIYLIWNNLNWLWNNLWHIPLQNEWSAKWKKVQSIVV